jgi:hypothetical protein
MLKKILSIVLISMIVGCKSNNGWFDYSRPANLNVTPPPGTTEYKMGWTDGCNSALSAINTDINLILASRKYRIDASLWGSNKRYKQAWKDAYYYCSYNMFTNLMNTY